MNPGSGKASTAPPPKPPAKDSIGRKVGENASAEQRREVIWGLILKGQPEWRITRAVVEEYGVNERTVRRDIQTLGQRVRAALGPEEVDRRGFACLERIEQIAVGAQTGTNPDGTTCERNLRVALQANIHLARLLGVKDPRWREKPAAELPADDRDTMKRLARSLEEINGLSDADLVAEHGRLHERLGALRVLPGGRAEQEGVQGQAGALAAQATGTRGT